MDIHNVLKCLYFKNVDLNFFQSSQLLPRLIQTLELLAPKWNAKCVFLIRVKCLKNLSEIARRKVAIPNQVIKNKYSHH